MHVSLVRSIHLDVIIIHLIYHHWRLEVSDRERPFSSILHFAFECVALFIRYCCWHPPYCRPFEELHRIKPIQIDVVFVWNTCGGDYGNK